MFFESVNAEMLFRNCFLDFLLVLHVLGGDIGHRYQFFAGLHLAAGDTVML